MRRVPVLAFAAFGLCSAGASAGVGLGNTQVQLLGGAVGCGQSTTLLVTGTLTRDVQHPNGANIAYVVRAFDTDASTADNVIAEFTVSVPASFTGPEYGFSETVVIECRSNQEGDCVAAGASGIYTGAVADFEGLIVQPTEDLLVLDVDGEVVDSIVPIVNPLDPSGPVGVIQGGPCRSAIEVQVIGPLYEQLIPDLGGKLTRHELRLPSRAYGLGAINLIVGMSDPNAAIVQAGLQPGNFELLVEETADGFFQITSGEADLGDLPGCVQLELITAPKRSDKPLESVSMDVSGAASVLTLDENSRATFTERIIGGSSTIDFDASVPVEVSIRTDLISIESATIQLEDGTEEEVLRVIGQPGAIPSPGTVTAGPFAESATTIQATGGFGGTTLPVPTGNEPPGYFPGPLFGSASDRVNRVDGSFSVDIRNFSGDIPDAGRVQLIRRTNFRQPAYAVLTYGDIRFVLDTDKNNLIDALDVLSTLEFFQTGAFGD